MQQLAAVLDGLVGNATGLLFVVAGVFILIRMAGFPDLTVDGSFTIGAALFSVALSGGSGGPLALLAAMAGGAVGGGLTWLVNSRLGVGKVVSSVLSMIILVLSAPYLSGGSTRGLLRVTSVFSSVDEMDAKLSSTVLRNASFQLHIVSSSIWLATFLMIGAAIYRGLGSSAGIRMRYSGSAGSPTLVPRGEQRLLLLMGLMVGNAVVALGGAVEAQRRGGFTSNMGSGMLLVALAILILGESIVKSFRKRQFLWLREYALAIVVGTFVYTAAIQLLLAAQVQLVDIRLLTVLFLLVLLGIAGRVHSSSTKLF